MNKGYTVIAGCGRLGASIAGQLSEQKENVIIIDCNKEAFRKLPNTYGGLTLVAGITDLEKLRAAEVYRATVFLAVTENDCINICAAQIAKKVFQIPKVIARVYDEEKLPLVQQYGIETICPTKLSEIEIYNSMMKGGARNVEEN